MHSRATGLTILALIGLSSCTPKGAGHVPIPDDEGLVYTPDWEGVTKFTDEQCAGCHSEGGSAEFLPLPLALHVDAAIQGGVYVVPEDPEASKFWRVISGKLGGEDFSVMPLATGPLELRYIDHVRLWILDGAPVPPLPVDEDFDGFLNDVDCNDADPAIHPDAIEICDGVDNNCDGVTDGADADAALPFYEDQDGDGYGVEGNLVEACEAPPGYAQWPGDCDDGNNAVNPGAVETDCGDPTDYNCDGSVGTDDNDADGFMACEECNDADAQTHPGADETCDSFDNDCDGDVDEDPVDGLAYHRDDDGDGYGDQFGIEILHCTGTAGWVPNGDDCDDGDPAVNPAAPNDPADGIDNDCDGAVDEDSGVVSHAIEIQPIWNTNCLQPCHSGFVPSDGLDLSVDAWDDFVGVASSDVPGMDRVSPGDPANSYLWHKLNSTQATVGGSGSRMPKGGQALTGPELQLIEAWILGGAQP